MKTETRLFWKFFFEQKVSEIWNTLKMLPIMVFAALLLVSIAAGIIAIVGVVSWAVFYFGFGLPDRLSKLTFDNIFAFGAATIIVVGFILIIASPAYGWIHANVEKARYRVRLQMENRK